MTASAASYDEVEGEEGKGKDSHRVDDLVVENHGQGGA